MRGPASRRSRTSRSLTRASGARAGRGGRLPQLVPGDSVARGRRPGAGRRTVSLVGDARGTGSGAHRRERAGAQGYEPDRWRRPPSATASTWCSRTRRSPAARRHLVTATGQRRRWAASRTWSPYEAPQSPLQRELDGLTKVFGILAWSAVAVIAIGYRTGQDRDTLLLLCISTAIASIPVGLPTFVQAMLSSGAQRLAESKAVVKTLTDVETLGGTTVINSDKTGTLTMNAMTATRCSQAATGTRSREAATRRRGRSSAREVVHRPTSGDCPSACACARTRPWRTTSRSSATRRRPRSSCSPPRPESTPRRRGGRSRDGRRCRSIPSTSSWPRCTTSRSTSWAGSSSTRIS